MASFEEEPAGCCAAVAAKLSAKTVSPTRPLMVDCEVEEHAACLKSQRPLGHDASRLLGCCDIRATFRNDFSSQT